MFKLYGSCDFGAENNKQLHCVMCTYIMLNKNITTKPLATLYYGGSMSLLHLRINARDFPEAQ